MAAETSPENIGWLFIQEYYARLNKDPLHLYQFYTKASSMIHGFEGECPGVATGQAEVQARVKQQKLFSGCNVQVSSVDSLGSLEGSVVMQVTGEMSNAAGRTVKFAQTFVLAPSKNSKGYYVLNDILRFLAEDEEEEYADFGAIEKPVQADKVQAGPVQADPVKAEPEQAEPAQPEAAQPEAEAPKAPKAPEAPAAAAAATAAATAAAAAAAAAAAPTPVRGTAPAPALPRKERKVFYSAYLKIPGEVDGALLRKELELAGQVTHLQIEPEKSRAFVDFIDQGSLDKALSMQTITLGPHSVVIEPRKRRKATK